MKAGGHVMTGIVLLAGVKVFVPEAIGAEEVVLTAIGSLLPDIDHKSSTLGRYNPFARFMKHRGKTHTLIGSILLSVPFVVFGGTNTFLFVLLGCISHLVGDKLYSFLPKKKPFAIKIW